LRSQRTRFEQTDAPDVLINSHASKSINSFAALVHNPEGIYASLKSINLNNSSNVFLIRPISFISTVLRATLLVLLFVFSHTLEAQYTIGGTASSLGGDCYRLTAASNSQAGYVYQNAAIDLNEAFDLTFDVYLGTNNGGADGIVFVLRGTLAAPYIGNNGGAIGYNGAGFSSNSIGIEVDTWFNGGFGDLAADHIGMFQDGTVNHNSVNSLAAPIQASATNANVEDGNFHTFNVRWDPISQDLEVYFDCDYRIMYSGDIINTVFGGDNMVHWGFLGTTGGANNVQEFCLTTSIDSLVTPLSDHTICNGDSVQLNAGDDDMDFTWTPAAGLSASNVNDPWASPASTTTYSVEIVHNCDTLYDTSVVSVIQPNFNAFGTVDDALCNDSCDGSIDLNIANGTGFYSFNWSTGDSIADIENLCAGTYTVTVQDVDTSSENYLCFLEETYTIDEPDPIVNTMTNVSNTSCPDGLTCDAEATATAAGGTFPYSFIWSTGEPFQTAQQLCADSNFVTITDANGCTFQDFVMIDIPDTIRTVAFGDTQICISNIASMIAATTGGTPPYGYVWSEGSLNGSVISNNQVVPVTPEVTTTYFVQSTDANGCTGDTSKVLVKVRPPLDVELASEDTICPADTVPVFATGVGGDSVYTFTWDNGTFGNQISVSPDLSRWFVVTVSDACGTPSYTDSIFVQVGGYPRIRAAVNVEDDSICAGESVYLISSAFGGFEGPQSYDYRWEHTDDLKAVQFVQPTKTTTYTTTVTDQCLSEPGIASITIHVGKASIPEIIAEPAEACAATDVILRIENHNPKYIYRWWVDDETFIEDFDADSLIWQFSEAGCNPMRVDATTDFGCFAEKAEQCIVRIYEPAVPNYETDEAFVANNDQVVTFFDRSENAVSTEWYIQGDTLISPGAFERFYRDTLDDLSFKLVAISAEGCRDSIISSVPFVYLTQLYFPKAFTPNGDGMNDIFQIRGEAISTQDFNLQIFDRWGRQAFRSVNPDFGWDGHYPNGERAPLGVYPFVLQYRDHLGELRVVRDQVVNMSGEEVGIR
jgi:gliding motility-associated-like protein